MNQVLAKAIEHWGYVKPAISPPKNDKEFKGLVKRLDELLDIVGKNEKHPLIELLDVVDTLVAKYEEEHYPEPMGTGIDALKYLMASNNIKQTELPEIGSQGVVSEILNSKRQLNIRQIKQLAKRLGVDMQVFMDPEA